MENISVAMALSSGETASGLIAMVERHPLLDLCGVARSPQDLARLLGRFRPSVLIISPQMLEELEGHEFDGPGDDGRFIHLTLSLILISGGLRWEEPDLVRAFRHPFLFCGTLHADAQDPDSLYATILEKATLFRDAFAGRRQDMEGGSLSGAGCIAMVGCKGGAGCTLLSCALSSALARAGARTLLLDLDRERSQLLHLRPAAEGKTLLDLLPLAEEISWDLVRVSVYLHPDGFHLLPFGRRDGADVVAELPEALLRNLAFIFDLIVLDLPGNLLRDLRAPLLTSREVMLVCPADTLSVRCARDTASLLRRMGVDARRMRLLINRIGPHSSLRPHEISHAVGIEVTSAFPEDAASGLDFAELAYLPRDGSPLGKAVRSLAETVIGTPEAPHATQERGRSPLSMRVPGTGRGGGRSIFLSWRK